MDKNARRSSVVLSETSADRRESTKYKNTGPRKSVFQGMGGRRQSVSMTSRKSSQDAGYPPRIKLQNTYRVAPEEREKFKSYKVEPRVYEILESALKDQKYDHTKCEKLTKDLTAEIMRESRNSILSNRYKVVSHVAIGEMNGQDIRVASRCLWDNEKDNSASVVYKNGSLYAVATVYAIYFE